MSLVTTIKNEFKNNQENFNMSHLAEWRNQKLKENQKMIDLFINTPVDSWEQLVIDHPAHKHIWYTFLADKAELKDYAQLFFENGGIPNFKMQVQKTLDIQITESGKKAVLDNLAD